MNSTIETWAQILGSGLGGALITALGQHWRERRKIAAQIDAIEADAESTLANVVERKLKTLIDSYESRIRDLTDEVHSLRAEVKALRKALDERPRPIQSIGI